MQTQTTQRELLKLRDIAAALGVTTQYAWRLTVRERKIPFVRMGRTGRAVRIPRAAWEAWLRDQSAAAIANVKGNGE